MPPAIRHIDVEDDEVPLTVAHCCSVSRRCPSSAIGSMNGPAPGSAGARSASCCVIVRMSTLGIQRHWLVPGSSTAIRGRHTIGSP